MQVRDRKPSLGALGEVFLGAFAIAVAVTAFVFVYRKAVEAPYWDEWEWARTILAYHTGKLQFGDLWAQHNEHRMLFPNLLMLGLDSFGYWSQRRECLFSVVVVTGSLWLLWRIARATLPTRAALAVVAAGSLLLFSPAQSENWLWGFQTAWFLVDLTVFAAAAIVARRTLTTGELFALALLAAVGSYSSAFGLAILPAVGLGLFVRRRTSGNAPVVRWIVVSLVIAAIYLWGWHPTPIRGVARLPLTQELLNRLSDILIVAGLPIGLAGGALMSSVAGAFGLIAGASSIVSAVRDKDSLNAEKVAPWLVILSYGAVASLIIGWGRGNLGIAQALSPRYITCALMIWIGLVGLFVLTLSAARKSPSSRPLRVVGGVCAVTLAVCFLETLLLGKAMLYAEASAARSRSQLLANYLRATDADLAVLYPSPAAVRVRTAELAAIGQLPEVKPAAAKAGELPREKGFAQGYVDDAVLDRAKGLLVAHGWAVDPVVPGSRRFLTVTLDGRTNQRIHIDQELRRDDVAAVFRLPEMVDSGFELEVPTSGLGIGTHRIEITLHSSSGVNLPLQSEIILAIRGSRWTTNIIRLHG